MTERLRADGVSEFIEKFEFNGSSGTRHVPMPVALAAGMHKLSAEAHWNTNGVVGESGKHKEHKSCGGRTETELLRPEGPADRGLERRLDARPNSTARSARPSTTR